jgi:hypothetical protein
MYDRNLGCYYGAQFDEGADSNKEWVAIKVYLDGVAIRLCEGFATEDEAEACALMEWFEDREANSQFGVGA